MLGETNRTIEFSFCPLDFCRINCYLQHCFLVQQISALFQIRAKDTPAKHPWRSVPSYFPRQPHMWGSVCSSAQTRSLLCWGNLFPPLSITPASPGTSSSSAHSGFVFFSTQWRVEPPKCLVQTASNRHNSFSASFYLQNTGTSIK